MITNLTLKNFTVFTGLTLELSPKINVIIGENGTGKTHLLKAAYGLCAGAPLFKNKPDTGDDELEAALTAKLLRLFMPLDDKLGKMHRQGATDQAYLSAKFAGGQKIAATFFNNSKALAVQDRANYEQIRIVYGGSMAPKNAYSLLSMPDIDGGLLGRAALVAEDFVDICKIASRCYQQKTAVRESSRAIPVFEA